MFTNENVCATFACFILPALYKVKLKVGCPKLLGICLAISEMK